jgi:hypothetical protein
MVLLMGDIFVKAGAFVPVTGVMQFVGYGFPGNEEEEVCYVV